MLQVLLEIQKLMTDLDCEPEPFQGRIIHVDVQRHRTGRSAQQTSMSCKLHLVAECAKKFSLVIGHSSDQGQKRNVMRQKLSGLDENGTESLSS